MKTLVSALALITVSILATQANAVSLVATRNRQIKTGIAEKLNKDGVFRRRP